MHLFLKNYNPWKYINCTGPMVHHGTLLENHIIVMIVPIATSQQGGAPKRKKKKTKNMGPTRV
jgi:hypothetical protein